MPRAAVRRCCAGCRPRPRGAAEVTGRSAAPRREADLEVMAARPTVTHHLRMRRGSAAGRRCPPGPASHPRPAWTAWALARWAATPNGHVPRVVRTSDPIAKAPPRTRCQLTEEAGGTRRHRTAVPIGATSGLQPIPGELGRANPAGPVEMARPSEKRQLLLLRPGMRARCELSNFPMRPPSRPAPKS